MSRSDPDMVKAMRFPSLAEAVKDAYNQGEEDERLEPMVVVDKESSPLGRFQKDDYVIFYDIRGEREIEITRSLTEEDFDSFPVVKGVTLNFVTMIEYDKNLNAKVAYPPQEMVTDTLCHVLSDNKIKFIKIVESEKAFHLTYFFNGKSKEPLPNEKRLIVPSLRVSKPEERPEMKIREVTQAIKNELRGRDTSIIIANLANVDVVGHTESEDAIIKAVEAVDTSLGEIVNETQKEGVTTIVTADHGTVEKWLYPDGTIDTGHTNSQVPFILIEPEIDIQRNIRLRDSGELADVAPTILDILGLNRPEAMTGVSLLADNPYKHPKKRFLLLILDGWGIIDEVKGNLIHKANTPSFDFLLDKFPAMRLKASGEVVGMPKGSVGNSEVGHLHIGAGRRIPSDRLRIDNAIENGTFYENPSFLWAMHGAKKNRALHLLGIVSFYSSHGSMGHLKALLKMAKAQGLDKVYVHSILGRRGEKKESGARYIDEIENFTKKLNIGKVVSVIGRHWVLDREENWDRVEKAYRCLVLGDAKKVKIQEA
ncbi:MAG: alkaline phosphatase family protein [Methanomassiliicoccales archaeon]|nr:MAG: alkaline phosphatase family protein [Methanomassiliicoccales archaeon]